MAQRRFLHPPRRAFPTRAGWFLFAAPLVLGVAAITASNNLLFILLAAALGAIVLSGVLSERNIRGVRLLVRPIGAAYAGEPARVELTLTKEDLEPGYAFSVHERPHGLWSPWKSWRLASPQVLVAHVDAIEDGRASTVASRQFDKRGPAHLARLELSTTYPFALLHKTRDVEPDLEVFVRPRRIEVSPLLVDPRSRFGDGEASTKRGQGLEVYGLRERRPNEEDRRLHALRTLALGRDVIIETAGVERDIAWLGVALEGGHPLAIERTLEHAQAALMEWDRRGYATGLFLAERSVEPGVSSLDAQLDLLARAEPSPLPATVGRRRAPSTWLVAHGAKVPPYAKVVFVVRPAGTMGRRES